MEALHVNIQPTLGTSKGMVYYLHKIISNNHGKQIIHKFFICCNPN